MKKQYVKPQFNCSDYSPDTAVSSGYEDGWGFIPGTACKCTNRPTFWVVSEATLPGAEETSACDSMWEGFQGYFQDFRDKRGDLTCDVSGPTICTGQED